MACPDAVDLPHRRVAVDLELGAEVVVALLFDLRDDVRVHARAVLERDDDADVGLDGDLLPHLEGPKGSLVARLEPDDALDGLNLDLVGVAVVEADNDNAVLCVDEVVLDVHDLRSL